MIKQIILAMALLIASPAFAQTTPEEIRAREIGSQLRCVVCQNQSIEESDAELAQDMRRVVREQIATGSSDAEVIGYIRDSYGDYVLLKPPVQANTLALWFLPALLLFSALGWFFFRSQTQRINKVEPELAEEDKAILDKILKDAP